MTKTLETLEDVEICPINDVHIGTIETDYKMFSKFIEDTIDKPNRYIVLVGDLINNAIKSSVSDVYSETMSPSKQIDYIVKELMPIKHKILAMVSGNHCNRSKKEVDINPSELIAAKLGIENYSSDELFLKLSLGKGKNGKRITYSIVLHHGAGGGSKPGGVINKAESYLNNFEGADMLIVGHSHRKAAYKYNARVLDLNNNITREVERLVAVSGSWMHFGGYAARFQLTAGAFGTTPILLSASEKRFKAVI